MRFATLILLWLLVVIPPAMILFFWWASRKKQKLLAQFIQARLLSALTVGVSPARRKIRFAFLISAAALLIVALARPQYGFDLQKVERRGLDIVVAIDTSKSMLATDITPDRLKRAKLAALELMQTAGADRMGLVAFAGDAFLECPLTFDNTAFQQSVQALNVNSIPQGGTAIASAIQTAQTAFKENDVNKVLVLLTDGEDNDTGALAAAREAAKNGLRIFTIGIGTPEGSILRMTDANGNSDYVRDANGDVVKSHLNESLLRQIAGATKGGFYLPLRGNTMDTLYEKGIAPLPKSESQEKMIRHYHEQFQWPLAAAILLLLAEMFLTERKKSKAQSPKPKVEATAIVALMAILSLPIAAQASPASALRDYKSGNFTNALEQFQQLAETRTNDLRLVFNAGDAAYRATNFDQAENLFQQVTLSPDLRLQQRAFYNLGNAQFQLAKSAKDLDDLQNGFETAEKSYARAVNLNTNDADASFNLAFTKNAIEQIKKFRAMMLRAKSEADAAVRQAEFHKALEIMAPLAQSKIAAKQFQDYIKKLKNIDDIATPHSGKP